MLASPRGERLFRVLFWLAVAYALLGGVFLRLWMPIILKHDNAFFMPLVFAMRNGLGFTNPWISPTGSEIFDWHGIVHPLLLSWLSPADSWAGVNAAVVFSSAVGMAAHLALIWRTNAPVVIKAICALFVPAVYMGFSGRPETTATLLMAALIAANFAQPTNERYRWPRLMASGMILGILGATHPIAAVITTVVYCAYLASAGAKAQRTPTNYLISVATAGVVAVAFFALAILTLYPYDVQNWVGGMIQVGAWAAGRFGEGGFLKYFAATKHTPFLLLTFVPFLYVMFLRGRELWPIASRFYKITLVFAAALLLLLVGRFPIGIPAAYYNYTVLLPALTVLVCMTVNQGHLRTWSGSGVALCLAAFAGLCCLAQALWVYQTVAGAVVRQTQKREIAALVSTHVEAGHKVAVDAPLLAAVDDVNTALSIELLYYGRRTDGGKYTPSSEVFDVVLRAQTEFAAPPPELPGFSMVKNAYLDGFGATSFSRPEHLGYAVYHSDTFLAGPFDREP